MKAFLKLKQHTEYGIENASSDTLITGCFELYIYIIYIYYIYIYIYIALLFNTNICHGVSPNDMLLTTLMSIPKHIK